MSALPSEIKLVVNMFCPYVLGYNNHDLKTITVDPELNKEHYITFCDEKNLKYQSIIDNLSKIIQNGDPIFIIEIFDHRGTILKIPLKASDVLRSL